MIMQSVVSLRAGSRRAYLWQASSQSICDILACAQEQLLCSADASLCTPPVRDTASQQDTCSPWAGQQPGPWRHPRLHLGTAALPCRCQRDAGTWPESR